MRSHSPRVLSPARYTLPDAYMAAHVGTSAELSYQQAMRSSAAVPPAESHPSHHGGHPTAEHVDEGLTPWQMRMEAKLDRMAADMAHIKQLLLAGNGGGALLVPTLSKGMIVTDAPPHMIAGPHPRGPIMQQHPHQHQMVPPVPTSAAPAAGGHSTSDKIDARRRRYPGFRGVPVCACCNKSFCLIFNSPGGKCKRGDQCEHAHHYMPPNAPTGSVVRPLAVPASFK